MRSLRREYLSALPFGSEDLSTLKEIGAFRGKQELYTEQSPEMLAALRKNAVVESR